MKIMDNLTFEHITSFITTVVVVALVGIWSVRKVKSSSDFDTAGRKAGWYIIAASILGTVVGGAITVGTAQMAYQYGFQLGGTPLGVAWVVLVWALFLQNRYGCRTPKQYRKYCHLNSAEPRGLFPASSYRWLCF